MLCCNVYTVKLNAHQLIAAVVCAGLYPRIVRVQKPKAEFQETMAGAFEKRVQSGAVKFFLRVRITSTTGSDAVLHCVLACELLHHETHSFLAEPTYVRVFVRWIHLGGPWPCVPAPWVRLF